MKEGLPRSETPRVLERRREAPRMLYVGLDLSRKRLDWLALDPQGEPTAIGSVAPDRDGLAKLGRRLGDAAVLAVIESMSGARFVHDELELAGWDVRIADAAKARGLAPLACKTDRIDCQVLAELARRDLVPEIWLPDPQVRAERERSRFRLHLVKHRYIPLLTTLPGVAWVLGYTIAAEIGDIARFASPRKLVGYTGLTPRVEQSGERDRRGPLRKNGPHHLRWALIEAAHTAGRDPRYQPIVARMRARHGKKRGSKIAAIEIARRQ